MGRGHYTKKPADRTIRVWADGHDITDDDPATWGWPYSVWYAEGWRPLEGPNSGGAIEGGVGAAGVHTTDFGNPLVALDETKVPAPISE